MHKSRFDLIAIAAAAVALAACASNKKSPTNTELAGAYDNNKYSADIETANRAPKHDDQGASIDPRTMAAIDDTIRSVYDTDFERCLEADMEELENRWIAGDFAVEFTIETSGKVSAAKTLSIDVKERRTKNAKGAFVSEGGAAARVAPNFGKCLETALLEWEFDPPPEVTYTHTYNGHVGEAW